MKFIKSKLTIVACVELSLSACSPVKTTTEYIESATTLVTNNHINAAIIELKNAIKEDPKSTLARYTLGKIYLEQGDLLPAIKELTLASQDSSLFNEVIPQLAQAYQMNGDELKLLELIEIADNLNDISKLNLTVSISIYYSQHNNSDKAQEYLDKAINISEDNTYSQFAKAWLKSSIQQTDDALILVKKVLASSPELSEALLLQGHLLSAKKHFLEAAESYQEYSKMHPLQHQVKLFVASNLISAEENEKAEIIVSQLL